MYDIIIIGGGPAGLTAAVYAKRAGKSVLVIEKETFGGQITYSPKVENIPGFAALSGNEFAEKLVDQALSLEADVEMAEVTAIKNGDIKTVITADGEFEGKTVIIATGARHRLLGLENEQNLVGNGISFCAVCDGAFYKDKTVAVVGGGNSAMQEAILLADTVKKLYVIQNLDFLTGEKTLQNILLEKPNVEVLLGTTVAAYSGENELTGITVKKESDQTTYDIPLDGLFLAVGLVPQNEPFADVIPLDDRGYAKSDEGCTLNDGIFVAGDCRTKKIRQVTTAASDGAIAALAACDYIDKK
ncbi:MAG: FAD-dependent oxidoreductase [Oscillospiraceae bacterium]|nr:FAD-dependent oxidoreductase [Candidatus Equicaccousia limihippi]